MMNGSVWFPIYYLVLHICLLFSYLESVCSMVIANIWQNIFTFAIISTVEELHAPIFLYIKGTVAQNFVRPFWPAYIGLAEKKNHYKLFNISVTPSIFAAILKY